MSYIKTKPSDGTPEEENNKMSESDEALQKFLDEADEERAIKEEKKKRELEELERERNINKKEDKKEELTVGGAKIKPKKVYTLKKGAGIFNRKGKNISYGSDKFDKKIEKQFKAGARKVSSEKQERFMKIFDRYHKMKSGSLSTVDRDEVTKFTSGLRRGRSDRNFKKVCDELKKEGIIKNSADVKKFFTKRELKSIRGSLTGQQENSLTRKERTPIQKNERPSRPIRPIK